MSKAQKLKPQLLPCPFCSNAEPVAYEQTYYAWVQCRECDAEGPAKDTGQEAIEAWNTRAPASSEQQAAQQDADVQHAVRAERERICAAIKAEDDYCVTQGDYMLDSDDCIKVARGEWARPVYDAARASNGGKAND